MRYLADIAGIKRASWPIAITGGPLGPGVVFLSRFGKVCPSPMGITVRVGARRGDGLWSLPAQCARLPTRVGLFFTQTEKTALYTENFADTLYKTSSEPSYSTYWKDASLAGSQAMLQADLYTYLTDDILVKVDRMSMAHSLEVRSPLLDQEVIAFMARVPRAVKYTEWNSKILLRSLAQRYLPQAILNRPKQGFAIPLGAWIRGRCGLGYTRSCARSGPVSEVCFLLNAYAK